MRSTLVLVALVASAHSLHGTLMDVVSTLLSLERKAGAMSPSVRATFGLVLCPSVHVSDHIPTHTSPKWTAPDLLKKIPADLLDPSLLERVYIPNLVVSPFTVNKGYAGHIFYNCISSPHLLKVLRRWDEERRTAPEQW